MEIKEAEEVTQESAEQDVSQQTAAEAKEVSKESIIEAMSFIQYLLSVRRALLEEVKAPLDVISHILDHDLMRFSL